MNTINLSKAEAVGPDKRQPPSRQKGSIFQLDKYTRVVRRFRSCEEAASILNLSVSMVRSIAGGSHYSPKYDFEYTKLSEQPQSPARSEPRRLKHVYDAPKPLEVKYRERHNMPPVKYIDFEWIIPNTVT